jgi:hypothetical protein
MKPAVAGTWASFYYGVVGSTMEYSIDVRPVGDATRVAARPHWESHPAGRVWHAPRAINEEVRSQ